MPSHSGPGPRARGGRVQIEKWTKQPWGTVGPTSCTDADMEFRCENAEGLEGGGKKFELKDGNGPALQEGNSVTFKPDATGATTGQKYSIIETDGDYITLSPEDSETIDLPGVPKQGRMVRQSTSGPGAPAENSRTDKKRDCVVAGVCKCRRCDKEVCLHDNFCS